jgi:hypothetical protein
VASDYESRTLAAEWQLAEPSATARQIIEHYQMTTAETKAARKALPYFLAAKRTPAQDEHDGYTRYKGRTAHEVICELVEDVDRQIAVMSLVVALARE